ncbi:hypothetical protein ALC57_11669 [Trachymyrmex cornetzi]|uniref:Uncharacterized protein n=1 Tax=Trachymyrmex cornetzi TaxID=471704 RepID=A0A151J2C1_9HYME|nr:hypothetical protein ALC57_11669 [Trachymyrmex cornetzi]
MPDYTLNEIIDIVLVLEECHNNYRQAAVLYRNRFPHRRHSNHRTISRLVLRQRQHQRQKRQRHNVCSFNRMVRLRTGVEELETT